MYFLTMQGENLGSLKIVCGLVSTNNCICICIYIYIFSKYIQVKFSYHQVISLIHRNICQNVSCNIDWNFAASMSENIYLLPCGFLKLLYFNFKAFQSRLDIDAIVFCLKNAEGNSVIVLVGIFNISNLKAHFKTTTTMVFTNFQMNFIFDEWIIDDHIASKKRENFQS